jgi:hypothetical protein
VSELSRIADVVVDGPAGMVALLAQLGRLIETGPPLS